MRHRLRRVPPRLVSARRTHDGYLTKTDTRRGQARALQQLRSDPGATYCIPCWATAATIGSDGLEQLRAFALRVIDCDDPKAEEARFAAKRASRRRVESAVHCYLDAASAGPPHRATPRAQVLLLTRAAPGAGCSARYACRTLTKVLRTSSIFTGFVSTAAARG